VTRWRNEAGFSLVETMVVVAIVGLMATAVVLSIPARDTGLEDALGRTQRAMTALARHSVMTSQVIGIRFGPDGFDTLALTETGWRTANDILKPDVRQLRPLSVVLVTVDGEDQALALKADEALRPHIWFLPTGEQPAFALTLTDGTSRGILKADEMGHMQVAQDG
jgi:general secretion pathway protein H